jgi:class 3 adenylate cyclase
VAGIVGKKRLTYGLFGDTINTASRFETASKPGRINVSSTTYVQIKSKFDCEYRGKIRKSTNSIFKYAEDSLF